MPVEREVPQIEFSPAAIRQVSLILQNDPTVKEQVLRLHISGKGCDGFDYALGFTEVRPKDLCVPVRGQGANFTVAMDVFSAQYLDCAHVDFVQEFGGGEEGREGFVITNPRQAEYKGKFWLRH